MQSRMRMSALRGGESRGTVRQKCNNIATHPKKEEVTPDGHLVAPKGQDARDGVVLVGEYRKPDDEVIPAHGHGEGWVDHTISKLRKGTA